MSKNPNNERFLQGYHGLRGPAWRLELARDLPANRLHRLVRKADPDVRDVHHYRQLQMRGDPGRTRAKAIYPLIAAAYALSQDKEKSAAAMLLTVGGCRRDEIAVRLAIDEVVLQKWESLFFDVRESREAVGWIHIHVIEPQRAAGKRGTCPPIGCIASCARRTPMSATSIIIDSCKCAGTLEGPGPRRSTPAGPPV